jgi:hypothetical protein
MFMLERVWLGRIIINRQFNLRSICCCAVIDLEKEKHKVFDEVFINVRYAQAAKPTLCTQSILASQPCNRPKPGYMSHAACVLVTIQ